MDSVKRLFLATPQWYFDAAFGADVLLFRIFFGVGTLALVVGVVWGMLRREPRLFLFLIPLLLSQFLVAVAGGFERQGAVAWVDPLLFLFLASQMLLCLYLIYRLEEVRRAATALSLFSITYAVHAAFVAGMSLTGDWL